MPVRPTDQSLRDQLRITDREVKRRQDILDITDEDCALLASVKDVVVPELDSIINDFYARQVEDLEIASLIGDSETLARLKNHLRSYILGLFDGQYDDEYVQARLRIGLVHNRIGVPPKLYVGAFKLLLELLGKTLAARNKGDCRTCGKVSAALHKVMLFDLTLVFDTYIQSLVTEVQRSRQQLEEYTASLEEVVSQKTKQLSEQARMDGLTGLLNQRSFYEELRREISRCVRRSQACSLLYLDLDKFKHENDTKGHKHGDRILVAVADAFRETLRPEDVGVRYGGDEFCVILPQTDAQGAGKAAGRIQEAFDRVKPECGVTMSVGAAVFDPDSGLDADGLVKQADAAMYKAKKIAGHSLVVHTP